MANRGLHAVVNRGKMINLPDGSSVEVRALTLKDIAQLEEQALHDHKRQYLETYAKNAEMLAPEDRQTLLHDAFAQAAKMSIDTLPAKEQVLKVNGKEVRQAIPYAFWWASNSVSGMLHSVWLSMRRAQPGLTLDQADELLSPNMDALEELADAVGELTSPTAGNLRRPTETAETPAAK